MDLREVARLEETRRATAASEITDQVRRITGGGVALRSEPGFWVNYAVGMGLNGPVPRDELASIIAWYEEAGIEPRFEVSPFVDEPFLADCRSLGLTLHSFGNVFCRELSRSDRARPVGEPPAGLEVRTVDGRDAGVAREYARVVNKGFSPSGAEPTEMQLDRLCRFVRHPRTAALLALIDGQPAGGGAIDFGGEVAALMGLSVLEEYRRRGIQQALIAARLNMVAERGARLATIGSKPGAGTERNVLRMGFRLAYTKVVLIKPGPGLTPIGG